MPAAAPLFAKVPSQVSLPAIEQGILALWERIDAFRESNRRRAGCPEFVFYDGPPFATGTPHYGHLLAGTIKDIVPRYWSMRGHHVERRFGWDCHGLPIESLAQNAMGLKGTPDIQRVGVAAFNEQCRSMVLKYVADWRATVTRMGRWVDFDNDYKTMDPAFMESVWWVFKRLWDQRDAQGRSRVYKAHRIMPYDPVLTTPLSNFEAGNNYKDVQDPAITVRFALKAGAGGRGSGAGTGKRYVLAWTTTPWTLPENLALCVGPGIAYAWVEDAQTKDVYLIAKDRISAIYKKDDQYRIIEEVIGKDVAGLTYEPLFPYFASEPKAFRVLVDDFVTTGDGTGIVHIAPAYGEDDYRVARAAGIGLVDPLDAECRFTAAIPEYAGQFCKDADKAIIKRLKDEGKLVHQSTIVHSYPFGERTDAPLIYRAIDAWYVRVEDLRERLAAANAKIRWVPEAIGANRFGNWLKDAKDWNISRNRFWGSCLPVWVNEADPADTICYGSIAELEHDSGVKVTDLHKHHLDAIVVKKGAKTYRRTPEVLDCWFESGAMPYAQIHWMGGADGTQRPPNFPAQFIAEGLDQTRGWFYTLLVLSTALFDEPAYRNVVVNGLVLAEDGQKMSKRKQNYPDPNTVLNEIGADALRAYLIDSPVVRAEPLRFSEAGLKEIVRTVVLPYWNALSFFTTYASVDGWDPRASKAADPAKRAELDRWLLSTVQSLVRDVNAEMEGYRLYNVVPRLVEFIDELTNWYIRLSRARFWKSVDKADQDAAYATLYEVLVTFAKVLAPFMPFLTEEAYQRLVLPVDAGAAKSIHWCDYPQPRAALIDAPLEADMAVARAVVGLGRKLREDHKLKVRQPLARITVVSRDPAVRAAAQRFAGLLADELNVKRVDLSADEGAFCAITVKPNFKELGKRAGPKLKEIGAALALWTISEVATLEGGGAVTVAGVELRLVDVLLQRSAAGGTFVASAGATTVALDATMTPELVAEGYAREFISVLQQARKATGLEVSDRIAVRWASNDADLRAAIERFADDIAGEVLATSFTRVEALADGEACDLNGKPLRFTLAKA
ncbi:MAG: isoleucine--tRNA ligase [Planctomycetes bacterium]|nr:isoleucine--tRNA ligase [Planctomycetota bacterium]